MNSKLKDAKNLVSFLEDQRQPWDDEAKLITKYLMPNKGRWWQGKDSRPHRGKRAGRAIMDSKGSRSLRILTAGMQGGLTPPSNLWFRLQTFNPDYNDWKPARVWLDDVTTLIYLALHKSNFYQAKHGEYKELAGFGSGCTYTEPHPERIIHFSRLTFGEYAWGADQYGSIDTNVRRFHMTAKQLVEKFGKDKVSSKTRKAYEKTPYEFVEIVQLIRPRFDRKKGFIDKLNKPWASVWYEENANEQDGILFEGGYDTFPVMASRWDVTANEVYGDGPGFAVLPDVKMLQELVRAQLMGIQKVINPPMRVPANWKKRVSHIPGGQNPVSTTNPEGLAPLYEVKPDIAAISHKIEDVRQAISEGFFNDLFQMFMLQERSNVTATEILEKQQEKMLLLGPVIERQQSDSLEPTIKRVYSILQQRGYIPPAPDEIAGMDLSIDFVSPLAQAQKMAGSQSILTLLTLVGQAAQGDQQVVDKIDWDQVIDEYARMTGAPARIVRSDDEVQKIRKQRAQAQAEEQAAQASLEAAQVIPSAAKELSETYVQSQSALDAAIGALS